MADAIDNGVFLTSLFSELMTGDANPEKIPIVCLMDCHSLFDALKSTMQVSEKRLRLEISNIRELIQLGQIESVKWIDTTCQLADCLTKKGASCVHLLRVLQEGIWVADCLNQ